LKTPAMRAQTASGCTHLASTPLANVFSQCLIESEARLLLLAVTRSLIAADL
jgi:hypothetical protein